jgi:hypothetical protein
MSDHPLFSVACHEAGHVIVADHFGLQIVAVRVQTNRDGGTDTTGSADDLPLCDQLAILAAGAVAKHMVCPDVDYPSAADDQRVAINLLVKHGVPEEQWEDFRTKAFQCAHDLLRPRVDDVRRIAAELAPRGRISGDEFRALLCANEAHTS